MWSKKKSPWEIRGFHRKWQGRIPFCYGQPIRLCLDSNNFVPHFFFESQVFMFLWKVIQFSVIM